MPRDRKPPFSLANLAGVTILELLVTVTVIAALATLTIPAWGLLSNTLARRNATALVMESLERARSEAITMKREVWVVFKHQRGNGHDALRLVEKDGDSVSAMGPVIKLPSSISFREGSGSLMGEHPPAEIAKAAFQDSGDGTLGSLMFRRSGGVGIPLQGGNSLTITLASPKGTDSTITLARAAGRASAESP